MEILRPRITDYYGIHKSQSDIDFAIQFFNEDIPLYVDPFLLWKSPSQQDQSLHTAITNSFNNLNYLTKKGKEQDAKSILIAISECSEVGLGVSKTRKGLRIGNKQAEEILSLFSDIKEFSQYGFTHFEIIQLYISGISKDRISDIACSYMKSFLIDYTIEQCNQYGIPIENVIVDSIYNYRENKLDYNCSVYLPINPKTKRPLIFTPKRWLRYTPWINFEEYFRFHCPKDDTINKEQEDTRVKILNYNRDNYDVVEEYIKYKEKNVLDCKNDPLFSQIPVISAKRKLGEIIKLKTGKEDGADWQYEDLVSELLSSLFYPHLDFAQTQSRTDSGRHIRDLIFYNNRDIDFLNDIYKEYSNRQLVFEMKNVKNIERDHINQLNRYLQANIGNFGIFITRNPLQKDMFKNTIDLWSAQRKCIISLDDEDLKLMVNVYESKQRTPIEVLKKKYIEFQRACPT